MSTLTGRLLSFDKKDLNDCIFPKNCEIFIPERVPLLMEYKRDDPSDLIGSAVVKRDDNGLICEIDVFRYDVDKIKSVFNNNVYVGGLYNHVESHMENDIRIIDSMNLQAVSITLLPADANNIVKETIDGEMQVEYR